MIKGFVKASDGLFPIKEDIYFLRRSVGIESYIKWSAHIVPFAIDKELWREEQWEWLDESIEEQPGEKDMDKFFEWAFKEYHWNGEGFEENTGHDDFETYTPSELYNIYKNRPQ